MSLEYEQQNYRDFSFNILAKMWSILPLEERQNSIKIPIGIIQFELCPKIPMSFKLFEQYVFYS